MTAPARQPWEASLVTAALPSGAVPTAAVWVPVGGRALRNSPDDVVALTEEQVHSRLPKGPRLVMSLRYEDVIDSDDEALTRLVQSTDGGVIVIGMTYDLPNTVRAFNQMCPECGSVDAELLGPADQHVAAGLRDRVRLYRCAECGTAWDD
jgi:hypothetical protein